MAGLKKPFFWMRITFSSPISFLFFLRLHIYCVCCNRELADCENIAFLTANADSTKKSRYMGEVEFEIGVFVTVCRGEYYFGQYLPLCVFEPHWDFAA